MPEHARRTVTTKLRYTDFSTITRAHSVGRATQLDTELFEEVRELFQRNWKPGAAVRLVGVMRQFEMLHKAISIGAEMNKKAVEEVARVGS